MRQLIATALLSVDGVCEAPGGEVGYRSAGWTMSSVDFVPEAYTMKGAEQLEATAMLLGRVTYQGFASVWPSMTEQFSRYNAMPKFVVSTTLDDTALVEGWGDQHLLRTVEDVAALKETDGGPILIHGSGTLVQSLTDAGLIDRFDLLVFPVLLGAGKRYFPTADKAMQKLELVEQETYSNGIQKMIFTVNR